MNSICELKNRTPLVGNWLININKSDYTNLVKEQHRKDDFDVNSVHLYHAEQWLSIKGHKSCAAKIGAKQAAFSSDNVKMEVTAKLNAAMSVRVRVNECQRIHLHFQKSENGQTYM